MSDKARHHGVDSVPDARELESAFRELGLRAHAADKIVEIAVYGGSALVLTLPGRVATKDVDAVMHHEPVWLRQAAAALAQEKRLALTTASKRRDMGCEMGTIDAMTLPRPTSLHDVATRALGGEAFDPLLREFLDSFYGRTVDAMASDVALAPAQIDSVHDAYLAAVAEHLALRFGLAVPPWVDEPHRFLSRPFFAGGFEDLKAVLLVESPLAFRRRQIFVSANALSRPREISPPQ